MANKATDSSGSILDKIYEKVCNTESITTREEIRRNLCDILIDLSKNDELNRKSTLAITKSPDVPHKEMIDMLDIWLFERGFVPTIDWQDKDHSFFRFESEHAKLKFIQFISGVHLGDSQNPDLNEQGIKIYKTMSANLNKLDKNSQNWTKKPVRIQIENVRKNIDFDILKEILIITAVHNNKITDLREGKKHAFNQSRSIMFKANAENIERFFLELKGMIQYNSNFNLEFCPGGKVRDASIASSSGASSVHIDDITDRNQSTDVQTEHTSRGQLQKRQPRMANQNNDPVKANLRLKIDVKPFQCKDCFQFGYRHQCLGKTCLQCGAKQHSGKECKSSTRFCSNCKLRGHRAKDLHCPKYIYEVGKEIMRIDLPPVFFKDNDMRITLIKHLIMK